MNPQNLRVIRGLASALLGGSVLLSGCASTNAPVHSMQDPQANFAAFSTFTWDPGKDAAQPVSILDGNIRSAIAGELQRKGYAEAAAGAKSDLVLQYETAAGEKMKSNPVRIGIGMGGYGSNGAAGVGVSSPSTKVVREGTLVLRAVDPARNAEVWNGSVSREIASHGVPDQALINEAVGELLQGFPSHGGAPKQ